MYKLKLIKGLSYSGVVKATKKAPYVETDDEATAALAVASGYFTLVASAPVPDADNEDMDHIEDDENQVSISDFVGTGDPTDDQSDSNAIDETIEDDTDDTVETDDEALAPDYEALSDMSREDLKAYAAEKGIDLTGVKYAKADILQAISKFYGGSDTMIALQGE